MGDVGYNFQTMKDNYLDEGGIVPSRWVNHICLQLLELLSKEENLLTLHSPITVCGDVHGQYEDVRKLFETAGVDEKNVKSFGKKRFLFLGDYVDRGNYSLNTFLLLAALKLEYPDQYFLLRGNHESRQVTVQYGFYVEMQSLYGSLVLYNLVMEVFDSLPYCAIIDNKIFATHGGLSPYMPLVGLIMNEERHIEIPGAGVLADLTWSDPDDSIKSWRPNTRGAGFLFGKSQAEKFCHINGINLILRSHQLAMDGYKWYFGEKGKYPDDKDFDEPFGKLLLVWSAPNYAYRGNNKASVLEIKDNSYSLKVFTESENQIKPSRNVQIPFFS